MVVLRLSPARCHCYVVSLWHRAALLFRFHAPCQGPVLAFWEPRGCSRKKKKRIFIFQEPALRIWQSREKVDALLSAELLSAGAGTQGPPNQSTPSGPTRSSPTSRLFPGDGIVLATPRTCQRKLCGLKGGGQHPTATRGWPRGRRGEVVKVVRGICWGRVTDWVDEELQTRA